MRQPGPTGGWRILSALCLAALCVLPGCARSGRKPVFPVRGQVFVDGKPAAEAFVYFHPEDPADPGPGFAFGQVDQAGAFAMSTYVSGDGVPAGDYIITIEWRQRSGLLKDNFEGPDRLKGRYADRKTSTFRFRVEKKPNEVPKFELSSSAV
jgi:hypothetical protein